MATPYREQGSNPLGTMIVFITLFIIVTILLAAQVLAPRLSERRVVYGLAPDAPCAFGPEMTWIALKAQPQIAADAIGLTDLAPSNWNSGIGTVYDGPLGGSRIFVSPPVDGWTFVVGVSLPQPHGRSFVDKCTPLLTALSEHFGDVHYFSAHPELDLFAWAKLSGGRVVRAFGIGDEGIIWAKGRPTREERSLGLKLFELRGVRGRRGDAGGELLLHPTQEHVMRLAGQWAVNPTLLDGLPASPTLGLVGIAPSAWRAERHRKTA